MNTVGCWSYEFQSDCDVNLGEVLHERLIKSGVLGARLDSRITYIEAGEHKEFADQDSVWNGALTKTSNRVSERDLERRVLNFVDSTCAPYVTVKIFCQQTLNLLRHCSYILGALHCSKATSNFPDPQTVEFNSD